MKDLYTFASTEEQALVLYEEVRQAYRRIFDRIGMPYVVVSDVYRFGTLGLNATLGSSG